MYEQEKTSACLCQSGAIEREDSHKGGMAVLHPADVPFADLQ